VKTSAASGRLNGGGAASGTSWIDRSGPSAAASTPPAASLREQPARRRAVGATSQGARKAALRTATCGSVVVVVLDPVVGTAQPRPGAVTSAAGLGLLEPRRELVALRRLERRKELTDELHHVRHRLRLALRVRGLELLHVESVFFERGEDKV